MSVYVYLSQLQWPLFLSRFLYIPVFMEHLVKDHMSCPHRGCTFSMQSLLLSVNEFQIVEGLPECWFSHTCGEWASGSQARLHGYTSPTTRKKAFDQAQGSHSISVYYDGQAPETSVAPDLWICGLISYQTYVEVVDKCWWMKWCR